MVSFRINGRLDGLNEYTAANRSNRFAGGKMKNKNETIVRIAIAEANCEKVKNYPCRVVFNWNDNGRRDIDNVAFSKKFILDALQKMEIIENDNRKCITSLQDNFYIDKKNEFCDVVILEAGEY